MPLIEGGHDADPRLVYMETGISEERYRVPGHRDYPFHRVQERYDVDTQTGHVYLKDEFRPYLIAAKDRAVQIGPWKLVWSAVKRGTYISLYDVLNDPLQRHDLSRRERIASPGWVQVGTLPQRGWREPGRAADVAR